METWWIFVLQGIGTLVLSAATLVIARGMAGVKQQNAGTAQQQLGIEQQTLINQFARDTKEAIKEAADATKEAARAVAASGITEVKLSYVEKINDSAIKTVERLEAQIISNDSAYKLQIEGLKAEIVTLQQRVDELVAQLKVKSTEASDKDAEIAALKAELAALKAGKQDGITGAAAA